MITSSKFSHAVPLGFATANLLVLLGCSSASEPPSGAGMGGLGNVGGTVGSGGGPASSAGQPGAAASTGGLGMNAGGQGVPGSATSCEGAKGDLTLLPLYTGGPAPCGNALAAPWTGFWFALNDQTPTGTQTPAPGAAAAITGEIAGRGGATDCAMHTTGNGFGTWGGGIAFVLYSANGMDCPFDASMYTGIRFYAKGTTAGTRGPGNLATSDVLRMKLRQSDRFNEPLQGDDYGGWCPITRDWRLCELPFHSLKQEGWGRAGNLSRRELTQVQFVAFKQGAAAAPPTTAFDFWVDDVSFY